MNEWSGSDGSEREAVAPVIPLFAERMPRPSAAASAQAFAPNHPAFAAGRHAGDDDDAEPEVTGPRHSTVRFVQLEGEPDAAVADAQGHREFAEKALLRKLRTRSLSVRESRGVLAGFDLAGGDIDALIDRFEANGYLDDVALAEQLVHAGSARKGQGRHAIAQTMSGRGIPRDIADAALADLPDDDLERALDYARSKAVAMARLDPQAGLRRLVGQLTRRGYPSHIAMTAARQALDEQTRPRGPFFA